MLNDSFVFDIPGIMSCQKNRYPMLFIDRIIECIPRKYAKGYKLFSYNEWFFYGHKRNSLKVPSSILIEGMSQTFLMTFLADDEFRGSVTMSYKYDNVQFLRRILPGERLDFEANLESFGRGVARGNVKGFVNGMLACYMECTIVIPKLLVNLQRSLTKKTGIYVENTIVQDLHPQFSIFEIEECLPNNHLLIYIDIVHDIQPGKFVKVMKNFTFNEHYFPNHFPEDPNVPGFIQIECGLQSFLLTFLSLDQYKKSETTNRFINNIQLKRKIVPGDSLELHAYLDSF
jgi:3-hydroxyacyl-[acyl-carrier-protein] dehydratase